MSSSARLLWLMLVTVTLAPVPARAADATPPIERFFQVDDRLFRGAQPDLAGFKCLRELGFEQSSISGRSRMPSGSKSERSSSRLE